MTSRIDRFLETMGGEGALPRKLTPPLAEAAPTPGPQAPRLNLTDYHSEEYRSLPHVNTKLDWNDITSALPKVEPAAAARTTLDVGANIPFDGRKGGSLPGNTKLSPFIATTKFCYKFVPRQWMQPLATHFFDQDKIYGRNWDLYYITTHSHGAHTFVPTSQVQLLLDDINAVYPSASIAIDDWQKWNGFVLDFNELPIHLKPLYLGRCTSRAAYVSWIEQLAREPNMVVSTVPTNGDRSFEAFKAKLDAAAALNKTKQKANKARKHAEVLVARQDIVRQAIRGQQYFGLHPKGDKESLDPKLQAAVNPCEPVPFPFDQEPILIAIDVEAFERPPHMITEIGLATLDTRDLKSVAPGKTGEDWHKFIRGRHLRILEWKDYKNSDFVQGCPGAFEFGTSEFVPRDSVMKLLATCFEEPYSGPGPQIKGDKSPAPGSAKQVTGDNASEQRNIIIVGHDLDQDVKYCEQVGFYIFSKPNIIDHLDTMPLYKKYAREPIGRSLGNILAHFELAGWFLHNAGNDAVYTMRALLAICVRAASERGTEAEAEKIEESVEKRFEASMQVASERAKDDADGWDLIGDEGEPKKPSQWDFRPKPQDRKLPRGGLGGNLYTLGGAPLDI